MKLLCKITHERCDEYDCTSYVMAPDDMTEEQFEAAIDRAEKAYIAFAEEWSAETKAEHPGYQPDYKGNPNKTVAEINADFAAKKAAYEEWERKERRARRTFNDYLEAEGFTMLWEDGAASLETTVYWGHRHGMALEYELPLPSDAATALKREREDSDATAF